MAYDISLEARIDDEIAEWGVDVVKRKMFGGLGYFVNRNMAFGVKGDELIVKPNPEQASELQQEPGMKPFEFGGKTMKSWCLAEPEILDEENLPRLLDICLEYVLTYRQNLNKYRYKIPLELHVLCSEIENKKLKKINIKMIQ